MSEMISVMRTGHLYKLDMADALLKEAEIPHFLRQELSSGLRLAMPVAPSMEPGTWWSILVPADHADEARTLLSELPFEITTNPGVWDSQPAGPNGRFGVLYRVFAVLMLAYFAFMMANAVIRTL